METTHTYSEEITAAVTAWPGVSTHHGSRGEFSFTVGKREIGHLHGDRSAHFMLPRELWRELHAAGRVDEHPVFPGREGPAARRLESEDDVRDVISIMRVNYDRVVAKHGA